MGYSPIVNRSILLCAANWRIQKYIHAKQKLIKLLEEQEAAIIHQAVTGKVDVRQAAAKLPDEDDLLENWAVSEEEVEEGSGEEGAEPLEGEDEA